MRRTTSGMTESYEQVLMCLICRNLFDDIDHQPKFLPCHHTFCKECLREYVRQMGDEIECPSCRKLATIPAAGVPALQTNFYVKYIESLVNSNRGHETSKQNCEYHDKEKAVMFCQPCQIMLCKTCCSNVNVCTKHKHVPLTTVTEQSHQKLDKAFAEANATIERKKVMVEGMLKCLAEEKDTALLNIESTFEQHIHSLTRRATLLKNKVIDIYHEHTQKLEDDLEEISTALTCIVSLKEYHEEKISQGDFRHYKHGIEDVKEVDANTAEKVTPQEVHIVFQDKHGIEKFRPTVKDLGRVKYSQPMTARCAPEGDESKNVANSTFSAKLMSASLIETPEECNKSCTINAMSQSLILNSVEDVIDDKPSQTREDLSLFNLHESTNKGDKVYLDARPKTLPVHSKASPSNTLLSTNVETNNKHPSSNVSSNRSSLTDDEKVKVEKQYYHTVYTSYDEEELLKELQKTPAAESVEEKPTPDDCSEDEPDVLTSSTASTLEDPTE